MTAVTIELIQAKQTELAALIAQLQAKPVQASTTIYIEEETFDLAPGEHYAGAVLDANGEHMHHLVLMAARPDAEVTWKDALEWAEQAGGALPTRQEQALLFANCKPHLQPRWHWSCEEQETEASYAWLCSFDYGHQGNHRKSFEGSAVAVRQITLAASPEVPARKPLAQVNRYCSAGMCLATDREHEADCPRAASPEQPK